jgi:DNA-binding IscR family transcriptional regulator
LIVRTSEPVAGFLPAREPQNIKLSDIAEAVAAASLAQSATDQPPTIQQIEQAKRNILAQYNIRQLIEAKRDS